MMRTEGFPGGPLTAGSGPVAAMMDNNTLDRQVSRPLSDAGDESWRQEDKVWCERTDGRWIPVPKSLTGRFLSSECD